MKPALDTRLLLTCGALLAGIWCAIALALWDSVYLDKSRYVEALYSARLEMSAQAENQNSFNKNVAEAYWHCYPDVAQDSYFGQSGPLGILGAREHYERHGRREGRIWPLKASEC